MMKFDKYKIDVEMADGTIINLHKSSKTQEHFQTIDINKNGKIYKIRIKQ